MASLIAPALVRARLWTGPLAAASRACAPSLMPSRTGHSCLRTPSLGRSRISVSSLRRTLASTLGFAVAALSATLASSKLTTPSVGDRCGVHSRRQRTPWLVRPNVRAFAGLRVGVLSHAGSPNATLLRLHPGVLRSGRAGSRIEDEVRWRVVRRRRFCRVGYHAQQFRATGRTKNKGEKEEI